MLKRRLRNRWLAVALLLVVAAGAGLALSRPSASGRDALSAAVVAGPFTVTVTTTGELRARKFVEVQGPPNAQAAEQWQMKIQSLVPEGTVVRAGDVVAELDRSSIAAKVQEVGLALTKAQAQHEQAQLDSTLTLSKAREEIRTLELALEEQRLAKEQSAFEAPTVRRKAEIDHEKATRALAQARTDYRTKVEQAQAKMREVGADLQRQRDRLGVIRTVMDAFTIKAPAPGMVIYVRDWSGRKKVAGAQVNAWEPTVATLPDLSQMESITYVNEIDVRRIAVGQPVAVTLDADPSKRLVGKVTAVANVGEQRPNQDAKVFEVKVDLLRPDTTLRPGMTTGNAVEVLTLPRALSVPIEAVSTDSGGSWVFRQAGLRVQRQQVETGEMNDVAVVVTRGLAEGERVLLSPPPDRDRLATVRLPGRGPAGARGGDSARPGRPVPVTDARKG